MLKELKGMEYALEILKVFHNNPGQLDSKQIVQFIEDGERIKPSPSYVAKILPRMKRAGLLLSSESGYQLIVPVDEIPVNKVLDICQMPETDSPAYRLCSELKQAVSLSTIDEFYNF